MCGIAGIIQATAAGYNSETIRNMTKALVHRGPDGEGYWENDEQTVLFGHRRLSIIDLSEAGFQPMHYLDRYTIIHNGEIYNYKELKAVLQKKGYRFRSQTDTEVIAAAFDAWQEDCVEQFDGMFAFAIWDEKEKKLFAARDRFGEKPFFYFMDTGRFLFASEMKALWAAGIPRIPNQQLLFNFITIGYTDNPSDPGETFFEHILKLPAATFLYYDAITGKIMIEKYWEINPEKQEKKIHEETAIEQFTELLHQSVKRRLRSDVAIGTSLSGGLDSTSITALIHELNPSNNSHKTFTAIFPGFEKDEFSFSREVADQFNLQQFTIETSVNQLLDDWQQLCHHQEEPFGSSSIYAQYKVYELAKKHGVKVLLDGQGADETLAGYPRYYKWYWQELFRSNKLNKSKELPAARKLGVTETFNYKNRIAAWFPSFASIVIEKQYLLKAIRHEGLNKEFVQQQSKEAYYTPPDLFSLNGALHFNTCIHGLEELLRYADRNAMAHGREIRLPFLSHELVEFVFALPSHFKIRNGWTKWILRETMRNKIPESITWRKDKTGFEPPQKSWMEQKGMQELMHTAKATLVAQKILKPETLAQPIIPATAHAADNYDWRYLSASMLF